MRIVCDKTQTMEKGLAGWPDSMPVVSEKSEILPSERDLWHCLAPPQEEAIILTHHLGFWDHLYLVGESVKSQYDVLRNTRLEPEQRVACVALEGKGFHGQRNRPWRAVSGNLHLSISVPLNLAAGSGALPWTMLPAVAVMRTLSQLGMPENSNCGIKWVNDVLCGPDKLAGVISSLAVVDGRIHRGFLGIGLNVANAPELAVKTCCLHQFPGVENTRFGHVLRVILNSVADLITLLENGQGDRIFQEYQLGSVVIGRRVCIMTDPVDGNPEEICRGKVLGINSDLGLLIEGQGAAVLHGRLHFL